MRYNLKQKTKALALEPNSGSLTVQGFELTAPQAPAQNLYLWSNAFTASLMNKSDSGSQREERKKRRVSRRRGREVSVLRYASAFLSEERDKSCLWVKPRAVSIHTQWNVSLALTRGSVPINPAVTSLEYPSPKKGTRVKSACAAMLLRHQLYTNEQKNTAGIHDGAVIEHPYKFYVEPTTGGSP